MSGARRSIRSLRRAAITDCTGLGLHIVYTIVTNCLGGRVDLESEPDKGTKISIVLPRVAPEVSQGGARKTPD